MVGELGEAELRAYVIGGVRWISHWEDSDKTKIFWRFHVALENIGATPTKRLKVKSCWRIPSDGVRLIQMPAHVEYVPAVIGARGRIGILQFDLPSQDMEELKARKKTLHIFCEAIYGNALNPKSEHITRIGMASSTITGNPSAYWHGTENPVNVAFTYISGLNCIDDECDGEAGGKQPGDPS